MSSSRITGGILHVPASTPSPSFQRIELEKKSGGGIDEGEEEKREDECDDGTNMIIKENDLVIAHVGFGDQKALRVRASGNKTNAKREGMLHTSYGSFSHKRDITDKSIRFGEKAFCSSAKGSSSGGGQKPFVWCLAPTCELWTNVLAHRTQILYAYDISLICAWLDLKPGKVVLESGTGSASLTHSLVRAVANGRGGGSRSNSSSRSSSGDSVSKGHVFTFEFNQSRADAAREEIDENGLKEYCTVTHRDIETNGFPKKLETAKIADAVFLDLPGPHKCVESSANCLKEDGVLCSFSPCVEQVQRTCVELQKFGFVDVKTVEMLGRGFDVNERKFFTDIEKASTGKFSRNLSERDTKSVKEETKKAKKGLNTKGEEEESAALVSQRVSAMPRFQGQTHTGYLTFARLAPLPEGWTKASWNERAEKKREAGKEILRAKVERDEGRKNALAPSSSAGKKRKQEDVAAVVPMPVNETKVHHHADEDEYSD